VTTKSTTSTTSTTATACLAWLCAWGLVACSNLTTSKTATTDAAGSGGNSGGNGATSGSAGSGATTGGGGSGSGGAVTTTTGAGGGSGGAAADAGAGGTCSMGAWPAADPSMPGPFATTTENNVGPAAGQGADGGAPVAFTMYRPTDLAQGGLCHPVVTWGNGTGTMPSIYRVLLTQLASHGFVVIASNSPNVAQGNPPPMVAGVTWVLQQNDDPTSELYHRIDTTHVGATGHSQGGFATVTAGADAHITTIAPIAGATQSRNLHGPALLMCGGMDTTVPCSTVMAAFTGINNQPVMLADQLAIDHANWITFRTGTPLNPYEVAVTAWMRVQLMGDTALRPMFYGPNCTLCTNTAVWQVMQKMMDQ
jgi:hypothetical protein